MGGTGQNDREPTGSCRHGSPSLSVKAGLLALSASPHRFKDKGCSSQPLTGASNAVQAFVGGSRSRLKNTVRFHILVSLSFQSQTTP